MHLFVNYCGYLKMAKNNTGVEYNLAETSDYEGYKNEDIGDDELIVQVSDTYW